jgi:hypothetical protein
MLVFYHFQAKMEAHGYENTVKKGLFFLTGGRSVQLARPN